MTKTSKFSTKFVYTMIFIAILLIAFIVILQFSNEEAYAQSDIQIIFPSNDYIQSSSPNLISANDKYLIVLDEESKLLFVRNSSDEGDYTYLVDYNDVNDILVIGDTALIVTNNNYYTIDLKDKSATLVQVNIPTPGYKVISSGEKPTLKTDGTYLYVKSVTGFITIYNENLEAVFGAEDYYDGIFTGKSILIGQLNILYTFTTNYGFPYLNIYNIYNGESNEVAISNNVQNAIIGNYIYAQINSEIIIIDKSSGDTLLATGICPSSYYAVDNNIFTIEGNIISIYTYNAETNSTNLTSSISMSGSDNRHLNNPKSILKVDNMIIIADSNNSRIGYISNSGDMKTISLESNPTKLAYNNGSVYAMCANDTIYKIQDEQITSTYALDGIIDIAYLDKLYALKNDGIYTLIGGKFIKFASIDNPKFISANKDGNNIYVITDSLLIAITKNGEIVSTSQFDFSNVDYFNVDYIGNIYILKNNSIYSIKNDLFELISVGNYSPTSNLTMTINSFYFDESNIYFSCDECLIVKDLFTSISKTNYLPVEPALEEATYYYANKTNQDTIAFNKYASSDSVKIQLSSTILISSKVYKDDYYYALDKDEIIIINKLDYVKIEETPNKNIYKTRVSSPIYSSLIAPPTQQLVENTQVTAIAQIEIENVSYIKIQINESMYYINLLNLDLVQEVKEDDDEKQDENITYGKIQTTRIGLKVNIYSSSSTASEIIIKLSDGKKVQILGEENNFYHIRYDSLEGYVEKDFINLKGITKIQLIAIILSLIVSISGITIFISVYFYRKKSE